MAEPAGVGEGDNHRTVELIPVKSDVKLQVILLTLGALLGWVLSYATDRYQRHASRPVRVPVFIQGQDRQGGQFALGVSRAMEYARRYRLDEVEGRRIEPWLIDENRSTDAIRRLLSEEDPPVIVGPLQSTPALRLIPELAGTEPKGLGIPMILGIPTNANVTTIDQSATLWRLSPTDIKQGEIVAKLFQTIARRGHNALLVMHTGENKEYVDGLRSIVLDQIGKLPAGLPALPEVTMSSIGETASIQDIFARSPPETIIYLGMTAGAVKILELAKNAGVNAAWIFTDSCITDPRLLLSKIDGMPGQFFITFQAPPASLSKGLQQYISYTNSTGGNVLFASTSGPNDSDPNSRCDESLAAPSYEIFGFDSYLSALLVIRDADKADRANVRKRMTQKRSVSHPLLIADSYKFDDSGNSIETTFYVYRMLKNCTRYVTFEELGATDYPATPQGGTSRRTPASARPRPVTPNEPPSTGTASPAPVVTPASATQT